ncbi:hypothetical protein SAMN05444005_10311 [Flavobacterium urocaniciphilum]|uniref:Uncharacterized protein n=1 Tax=Flavobacterium urocaniciphilum TaxID=1299341 RepID=A0A1H9BH42_9FLAO|nr:hypothetical protein SAMN05444005_10311 [Flavobacterium urocaniciphilum]
MKILKIVLKSLCAVLVYTFLYSLFSAFKIDFINFKIQKFDFNEFFSVGFLLGIYLIFSYFMVLVFLTILIIEKYKVQHKIHFLFLLSIIVTLFGLLTFVFDTNFSSNSISLNRFLYSCLSISIVVYLLFGIFKIKEKIEY